MKAVIPDSVERASKEATPWDSWLQEGGRRFVRWIFDDDGKPLCVWNRAAEECLTAWRNA